MSAAVCQWLATDAAARPSRSHGERRSGRLACPTDNETPAGLREAYSPCHPDCPICTERPTPAEQWDGPYTAYRWSPELEAS